MNYVNGKTRPTLQTDLVNFFKTLESPSAQTKKELKEFMELIATRTIPNTKREKANIVMLLSLLFISVYPELQTPANHTATLRYLKKIL